MKKKEDKKPEYLRLLKEETENEERGSWKDGGENDEEDVSEAFEEELDEKTLRFVRRVLFPSAIALVVVIVAAAATFFYISGKRTEKEAVLAAAEQEGTQDTPENQEALPGQTTSESEETQSEKEADKSEKTQPEREAGDSEKTRPEKEADKSEKPQPEKADGSGKPQPEEAGDGFEEPGSEKTAVSDKENPDTAQESGASVPEEDPADSSIGQDAGAPEEASADAETMMSFMDVSEEVTAKEATNLRSIPSQGNDSTVVYTLQNGESLTRTGVSDSGWSRLNYDGQTVYAVSSYLTTDLAYQAPKVETEEVEDGGLKTKFSDRNEQVTAKIEVNLRVLPSVTNPDATVAAVLRNGEYATRTGINEDYGWSRVEYNGQTLYCISSYLCE